MNEKPQCAVCGRSDWEVIGERTYRADLIATAGDYVGRRLQVLFEIWCRGRSEVTLRSELCRQCGFVGYAPRPSEEDLDRKYQFLTALGLPSPLPPDSPVELARGRRLFRTLHRKLPRRQCTLLDFGGGDGRLMRPFLDRGHHCAVVDYEPRTLPGIDRLGATLDEMPRERHFDAIVCSHVIEHVADPAGILTRLREHLHDDGTVFVEVPMEIWRRAPLDVEPVTHVNFFTERSLEILLARCGFVGITTRLAAYENAPGCPVVAVVAMGSRRDHQTETPRLSGAADATRALLKPGRWLRLRRALLTPRSIPRSLASRLRLSSR